MMPGMGAQPGDIGLGGSADAPKQIPPVGVVGYGQTMGASPAMSTAPVIQWQQPPNPIQNDFSYQGSGIVPRPFPTPPTYLGPPLNMNRIAPNQMNYMHNMMPGWAGYLNWLRMMQGQ